MAGAVVVAATLAVLPAVLNWVIRPRLSYCTRQGMVSVVVLVSLALVLAGASRFWLMAVMRPAAS
jgi:hypothetical protein